MIVKTFFGENAATVNGDELSRPEKKKGKIRRREKPSKGLNKKYPSQDMCANRGLRGGRKIEQFPTDKTRTSEKEPKPFLGSKQKKKKGSRVIEVEIGDDGCAF